MFSVVQLVTVCSAVQLSAALLFLHMPSLCNNCRVDVKPSYNA